MDDVKKISESARWVSLYADQLFKFAVSRVQNSEIAKDLLQETFLSALKSIQTFRGEVSELNWLHAILKNKIIDHYRSKATQASRELNELFEEAADFFDENGNWQEWAKPKPWGIDNDQNYESDEFFKILEKCKQQLAELQNTVFTLKYLDDKNSDEICKELKISSSNYWVLMHRAKLHIRQCLEKNWFIK